MQDEKKNESMEHSITFGRVLLALEKSKEIIPSFFRVWKENTSHFQSMGSI